MKLKSYAVVAVAVVALGVISRSPTSRARQVRDQSWELKYESTSAEETYLPGRGLWAIMKAHGLGW